MTELELIEKLKDFPQLREQLEQLVAIVENVDGKMQQADEVEKRVMEMIRSSSK